ncbi:DUF2513 domain-containing protein [Roseitalea porphyridii]|uniref:DUF2513 domain-containing protein n=1 Tax=Roseitalea porphyridii TaxID=1852022 RepID=A0A4P6V4N8_9HYPH|nr:DUF2513 domain-containing protein [Roseitalea porphyridii]QBK31616.1 DUF2513 domain-containing protein [Roseitalea porphyridii]
MKRDMDLIREVLLQIEDGCDAFDYDEFEGEADYLEYQLVLLRDAGFIDAHLLDSSCAINKITWDGHDFLDSVRDPEIWRKTKDGAAAAGGFTVELLGELAKGLIKTKIKQHTGIDVQ